MTTTKEAAWLVEELTDLADRRLASPEFYVTRAKVVRAAQEIRTLHTQVEELRRERDNWKTVAEMNATSGSFAFRRIEATEARATKAEVGLEQQERVIAGLNKQLTEQFELASKYVAKFTKAEAGIAEAVSTMTRLCTAAGMLQQNSEGCAINHYGHDFEVHGLPGWLADTKADIAAARAFVEKHKESGNG